MHNPASVEASLIDELEPEPHAIRERPLAAADDDGRDEEFDLVDQAGPEGVRREFVTTDHEILRRSQLHVANAVGVERRLESRHRHRELFQRLRVDDTDAVEQHLHSQVFLTYGEIARYRGRFDGWHNTTAVVTAIPA